MWENPVIEFPASSGMTCWVSVIFQFNPMKFIGCKVQFVCVTCLSLCHKFMVPTFSFHLHNSHVTADLKTLVLHVWHFIRKSIPTPTQYPFITYNYWVSFIFRHMILPNQFLCLLHSLILSVYDCSCTCFAWWVIRGVYPMSVKCEYQLSL